MFLLRKLHKWFGLVLGLQFLLWSLSGAVMALIDHGRVKGHDAIIHALPAAVPAAILSLDEVSTRLGEEVSKLELRPLDMDWVYVASTPSGTRLLDPVNGEAVVIDEARARLLAISSFVGSEPIASVDYVEKHTLETRTFALPAWRVEFADKDSTTLIMNATTGEVSGVRNDTWRVWDIFWMLHIMDYTDRQSFNHPLIIFVAVGCLWLSITGFVLLFRAFRRQDFAYIHDSIDWIKERRKGKA